MSELNNEPLTFEKVWAMFQETDRQIKEADRKFQESRKQAEEEDRKLREQMKETDRQISKLGNRFGELAEHLVIPGIKEKFKELNFTFEQISQDVAITEASTGRCLAEIDILLENGDTVIAVEVKSKPNQKDADEHINRMEVLRQRADKRKDTRKFQGAIAGAIMMDNVRDYIHKKGFYVLEQSGDTMKLDIPKDFKPREW